MAVAGQQFRAIKQRPARWVRLLFVRAARVPPLAIAKLLFHHEAFFRGEKKRSFMAGRHFDMLSSPVSSGRLAAATTSRAEC
jgi:hypothetical protein